MSVRAIAARFTVEPDKLDDAARRNVLTALKII
jgi:hypothetical protein